MWFSAVFGVISLILVSTNAAPTISETENGDENSLMLECKEICNNSKAEMRFDQETLTCKCVVVANVDDGEAALIKRKLLLNDQSKRDINPFVIMNTRTRRYLPRNNDGNKIALNRNNQRRDPIVGQVLHPLRPHHVPPAVLPPHKPALPLPYNPHVAPAAKAVNLNFQKQLENARQRLHEVISNRNAKERIEHIRRNLKDLRTRASAAMTPQQREARARAYQDKLAKEKLAYQARVAKEKQRIQNINRARNAGVLIRPHRLPLVGSASHDDQLTTERTPGIPRRSSNRKYDETPDDFVNPKQSPNNPVITEPLDLVEDE